MKPLPRGCAGKRWIVQEIGLGSEEQRPRDGGGEVQDAIGVPGWVPDVHVAQHPLGDRRSPRIPDVVGPVLRRSCLPKGMLARTICNWLPSGVVDHIQRNMGVGRLLTSSASSMSSSRCAADHPLLFRNRQGVPRRHVVQVLLNVHRSSRLANWGSSASISVACAACAPSGFSVPSTNPECRSRLSKTGNRVLRRRR